MKYLPLFHRLQGGWVLVVGGGEIALRKARLLAEAGGLLRVVAPEVDGQLATLAREGGGEVRVRGYQVGDLEGCRLVIAATDDAALNAQVSADAQAMNLPVNVVDAPALCTVIFPAIVDRSPLVIAVSSGGDAPVLARLIRAKFEAWIPSAYGELAGLAARFRDKVKGLYPDVNQRRGFWETVFQGPIAERQLAGQGAEAERLLQAMVDGAPVQQGGEVYLVGAGPGDPDLLTFRALRLMQQADVVLYDRLVAPAIIDMCRRDAERIYVGKRRAEHAVPQEQINRLLVQSPASRSGPSRQACITPERRRPIHFRARWRGNRRARSRGYSVSGCAWDYRSQRLFGVCRHSADPSRSRPVGAFRHWPSQRWHQQPAVD